MSAREFVLSWHTTSIGAEADNHLQIVVIQDALASLKDMTKDAK